MIVRGGLAAGALALALLAAGCASTNGLSTQASLQNANALAADKSLEAATIAQTAWPRNHWWTAFGDRQLDALIDEALAGSPTLKVAEARTRKALAFADVSRAALSPRVDADYEATRERFAEHGLVPPPAAGTWSTVQQMQATLSWELDFWGRIAPRSRVRSGWRKPPRSTRMRRGSRCRRTLLRRTRNCSARIFSSTSRRRRSRNASRSSRSPAIATPQESTRGWS